MGKNTLKLSDLHFREWREWAGLTQAQLASAMGVSVSTVSRVESGQREFTASFLLAFHDICKTPSLGTVLDRKPDVRPHGDGAPHDYRASPEQVKAAFKNNIGKRAKAVIKAVRDEAEQAAKGQRPGPKKSVGSKDT